MGISSACLAHSTDSTINRKLHCDIPGQAVKWAPGPRGYRSAIAGMSASLGTKSQLGRRKSMGVPHGETSLGKT